MTGLKLLLYKNGNLLVGTLKIHEDLCFKVAKAKMRHLKGFEFNFIDPHSKRCVPNAQFFLFFLQFSKNIFHCCAEPEVTKLRVYILPVLCFY